MKISVAPLFIFLLLVFSGVHSQSPAPSWKVQLSIGPAFPVGHFASTYVDSGAYSAALTCPALSFSISYRFNRSPFVMEFIGGWQQNNVSNSTIAKSISESVPMDSRVYVKSDNWHIWKMLMGPGMEIPMKIIGKTDFECALLAGILKTTIPGMQFAVFDPVYNVAYAAYRSPFAVPVAFCYQVNAGVNYRMTSHTSLACDLQFMHATPVHSFIYYQDPPYYTKAVHVNQSYPISTLNIELGVSYDF